MLIQILIFLINTLAGLVSGLLIARFLMQWLRAPFRNPLGQFVLAATDWIVLPARRLIPGLMGLDLASLLSACLVEALALMLKAALVGVPPGLFLLFAAVVEVLRTGIHLLIGAIIVSAVLSWVNPHSPLAPLLNTLTRPLLRPFQRLLPPVGNVDLSPLALIIVLNVLLFLLDALSRNLMGLGLH